jgi:hypothetical protein
VTDQQGLRAQTGRLLCRLHTLYLLVTSAPHRYQAQYSSSHYFYISTRTAGLPSTTHGERLQGASLLPWLVMNNCSASEGGPQLYLNTFCSSLRGDHAHIGETRTSTRGSLFKGDCSSAPNPGWSETQRQVLWNQQAGLLCESREYSMWYNLSNHCCA